MNPLSYFYTIRSYVQSYGALVGTRFISIIWVVAICVLIWLYGYMLAFGTFKPLGSTQARIIAILLVIAAWLIYIGITIYRNRKKDKELTDSIEQEALANRSAEVGEIHARLKEALSLLRRVTKKRFGYIYDLPWFVIFGAPGSGKTTALTNSGLQFPLGDALGENALKGIGGTRNCNWWFSDEAILIDTAGRYTTQDDLDGTSKAGWEGFLNLLRRYRRSQPVNGAIVTLSIPDLLNRNPEEQRQELRLLRQRLSELDEFLKARIPLYIVLTKADLLEGFVDFFDGFNNNDRQQVWGTTFKLDESYSGKDLIGRLDEEFELLQQRIDALLIERLQQEPNAQTRGRIFQFPAQVTSLKAPLIEAIREISASSNLIEAPLIRGVYIASGTQERSTPGQQQPVTRKSYFLEKLFKNVIFEEASLVMHDKRLSGYQLLIRRFAYGAAIAAIVLVFSGWISTYFLNKQAIEEADRRLANYERSIQGIQVRDVADADFLRILPALDNLRDVNIGFNQQKWYAPSFGLDQKEKLSGRHDTAYHQSLTSLLLPRLIVQLQNQMQNRENVKDTFNSLKLYGMLGGMGSVDKDFVVAQSGKIFAKLYPGDGRATARKSLSDHVATMANGILPPMNLDAALIADARSKIQNQALGQRAYDILTDLRRANSLSQWSPAQALGPLGARAFERKSKQPLGLGIAGLYTAEGYRTVVLPQITNVALTAMSEGWVRGSEDVIRGATVEDIATSALQIYFDEFETQWTSLLGDLNIKQSQDLGDAVETTRILASERNIIIEAAKSIAEATDLRGPGPSGSAIDETTANAIAGTLEPSDPFRPLRTLLAANGSVAGDETAQGNDQKAASFAETLLSSLKALSNQLGRSAVASEAVSRVFDTDSQLTKANQDLLQLSRAAPYPLDIWVAGVSADVGSLAVKSARSRISTLWATEGGAFCTSVVSARYPFDRASKLDVALTDFTSLFGPKGVFQSFFDSNMEPFVDKTASPWAWKGTFGSNGIPSEAIAQFEKANDIQRAFFPNGSETPNVAFNIRPVSLSQSANAVMLEIEGERVVYYHGPIQAKVINWPKTENTARLSRIAFQPGGWQQAITQNGDWSAFRLFDGAKVEQQNGDQVRFRFSNTAGTAQFDVSFGSVINPFQLDALAKFTCPAQF